MDSRSISVADVSKIKNIQLFRSELEKVWIASTMEIGLPIEPSSSSMTKETVPAVVDSKEDNVTNAKHSRFFQDKNLRRSKSFESFFDQPEHKRAFIL